MNLFLEHAVATGKMTLEEAQKAENEAKKAEDKQKKSSSAKADAK